MVTERERRMRRSEFSVEIYDVAARRGLDELDLLLVFTREAHALAGSAMVNAQRAEKLISDAEARVDAP